MWLNRSWGNIDASPFGDRYEIIMIIFISGEVVKNILKPIKMVSLNLIDMRSNAAWQDMPISMG